MLVTGATLLFATVAAYFDFAERWQQLAARAEQFHVDELSMVAALLSVEFGVFAWRRWRELSRADRRLQALNAELTGALAEIERRSRDLELLTTLGDRLHRCQTTTETRDVIAEIVPRLFPADVGQVALLGLSDAEPNLITEWGGARPADVAMLRGCLLLLAVAWGSSAANGVSPIARGHSTIDHLCLPLGSQGRTLGLIHLSPPLADGRAEPRTSLVHTVAEQLTLALSNLHFRHELHDLSVRDPLTGLFNRRHMNEEIVQALQRAARGQRPLAVLLFDLDRFKDINDRLGHEAGDAALTEVGRVIRLHFRAEDILCRLGGDEFGIILPDATLRQAHTRGEAIREALDDSTLSLRGIRIGRVSASIGVAAFPEHGQTAEMLLCAADEALYQAKRQGRNQVVSAS